ncbi:MAG: copper ion binding protein, partial [Balneolaceae bacterium]
MDTPTQLDKKTLDIEGMHCASCVSTVEKSLNKVKGVEEASVNLATESATVSYDADKVSDDDLRKAVEAAGYSLVEKEPDSITLKIEGMHCAGCVNSVLQSLEELEGVEEANVNLATESAKVTYSGELSLKDFERAVENAGYTLLRDEFESGQSKAEAKRQRE